MKSGRRYFYLIVFIHNVYGVDMIPESIDNMLTSKWLLDRYDPVELPILKRQMFLLSEQQS
jgi:hypothetical protein